jgi:hypothetical protein
MNRPERRRSGITEGEPYPMTGNAENASKIETAPQGGDAEYQGHPAR